MTKIFMYFVASIVFASPVLAGHVQSENSGAKSISLYKVYTDHYNQACKSKQFIADQMTLEQCLDLKEINIQMDEEPKEAGEPTRLILEGPHAGKVAWIYTCMQESAFESWFASVKRCK